MNKHRGINIDPPRELTATERGILNRLLSTEFPGNDALRMQVSSIKVSEECSACLSIVFSVNREDSIRADVRWRIPVEAEGLDSDGTKIHFMLHVVDGFMDELEVIKEDFSTTLQLPPPENLEVFTLD